MKWFAYAGALFAGGVVINQIELTVRGTRADSFSDVLVILGALGMPISVGIAILRYRLYEIDLILSRTLVYGPLTATLAGAYSASIFFFRLLFVDILGISSDAAIATTVLMLAALFVPLRNRLQGLADRLFKEDEHRRLLSYSKEAARAAELANPTTVAQRFVFLALEATGASGGRVVLLTDRLKNSVIAEGAPVEPVHETIDLNADGVVLGKLELGPPSNGLAYRDADIEVARRAAGMIAQSLAAGQLL